jgi:Fe-S oxidoreductase
VATEGGILQPETIWACTTCGWCETACPVFIENVPRLIDMRRYKVQVEADFPPELQRVFEGVERQGNPWGLGQDKRDEWEGDLPLPKWGDGGEYEYLFYVGCAGSYDERMKKVSRAVAKVLLEGGVKFATLGKDETCNAELARRAGNEYLYQTMAKANVESWNAKGIKTIVTQCPHCFNTIKNEYPEFGGNYRVISHTELINELLQSKRIKLSKVMNEKLTFHDPCYLGRHNGVYDDPREAIDGIPGLKRVEMAGNCRDRSFCCGGGGLMLFYEPEEEQRMGVVRVEQARKAGADVIVTACPYCMVNIEDAIKVAGLEGKMEVIDLVELVDGHLSQGDQITLTNCDTTA